MRRRLGQIVELPDTSQSHLGWSLEKPFANVKCVSGKLVQNDKTGVRVWIKRGQTFKMASSKNMREIWGLFLPAG